MLSPVSSEATLIGSTCPRLWTRPLCDLSPDTSYGFEVIWFADRVLGAPLDPWQQWVVIHAGELLPDGRPRFRRVLIIVARQNGKTHLCKVLSLYWLFRERWPMVFGTSTNLMYAEESWQGAIDLALSVPALADLMGSDAVRLGNGKQQLKTVYGARYRIGAANRRGGRSLSIDRLVMDELREHHHWDAYNAAYNGMNARPNAQCFMISNQGDDRSVVLSSLRSDALAYIETGQGDPRLGLFEYSAPDGSRPDDTTALAAANPNLGRRLDIDAVMGPARQLSRPGADPVPLAGFLTEVLCMAVPSLDSAIDAGAWRAGCLPAPLTDTERGQLAACVDIAPDGQHATLAVAALAHDGRTRVEVAHAWETPEEVSRMRRELPAVVAAIAPRTLGWFPNGPAAQLDAEIRDRRAEGRRGWPPPGVGVAQLNAESAAVCMGFASRVRGGMVVHSGQAILDAQIEAAERLRAGDVWRFYRRGSGHVDAVYAAAGADHLARTAPVRRASTRFRAAG